MRIDTFTYELPPSSIAQHPASDREAARLLVLGADKRVQHASIRDLASVIPAGALVVLNDTRVIPARLLGKKSDSGGKVEIFLVRRIGTRDAFEVWRALGKSSKGLKVGHEVTIDDANGAARLVVRVLGKAEEDGLLEVGLVAPNGEAIDEVLRAVGHVPLPPYIRRGDETNDAERYQTVFARVDGAVAAPTAGLHLTTRLLAAIEARGCEIAHVTLHVGLGTFQPVTTDDLDQHPMHAESFEISPATVSAVARARERGAPVVAIGTTVVRALESAADPAREGHVEACARETRLLIQPGYRFRVVDQLLTNFHLPKSTLLALVCAFGGTRDVLDAYETAVRDGYRFFSYGDAMYLTRASS